jgi:hypothetical protein
MLRIGVGLIGSGGGDSELVEGDGEGSNEDRFRLRPMMNANSVDFPHTEGWFVMLEWLFRLC